MLKPQVSIIVPFYNTFEYIPDLLESIKMQSMVTTEVIFVNDGSTAEATQHLLVNLEKFRDSVTTHYFTKENEGAAAARNFGLLQTSGEYVLYLDNDDMLCGRYSLYSRMHFLEQHKEFSGVAGYPVRINNHGQPLFSNPSQKFSELFMQAVENPEKILHYYCQNCLQSTRKTASTLFFATGSTLFRKTDIENFSFNPAFDSEDDVEWLLRFLQQKMIKLTPFPYHFRRFHEKQYHFKTTTELTKIILQIAHDIEKKTPPQ